MPDAKPPILQRITDTGEQLVRLLRDAAIAFLVLLLLVFPDTINQRISRAGFTKFGPEGFTWQKQVQAANEQTRSAAGAISNASQTLTDAHQTLASIEQQTTDPKVRDALVQLSSQLNGTLDQVQQTDSSLKQTVLTQQTLLAQAGATPADQHATSGWIYIGEMNQDKSAWVPGSPVNIVPVPLPIRKGQPLTIAGANYLRADTSSSQHREGKILTILRDGTLVHVSNTDPNPDLSHALAGGWFVWVRVTQ